MRCPSCDHENRAERRFCAECGATFAAVCASCGATNQPGERFCGGCGVRLATEVGSRAGHAAASDPALPAGERRQLTVMFCDLVGSTALSQQLDAEEWRDVVVRYQATARTAIERWGGHVAKELGDGLLVYFGWPTAREDDPERAIRAGLAILDAMVPLNAQLAADDGTPLAVRIGTHTGPVVIADGGEVFGETVNVAARVQAAAEPDTVVITAATQRLTAGIFLVEERGPQPLKGVREPVVLYRVLRTSGVRSRLDVAGGRLSPYIGRKAELAALLDRWKEVTSGRGQNVLVIGEAGVGKSRLAWELRQRLATEPHTWLECRATPYTTGTPFFPITELVQQGLLLAPDDTDAAKAERIERALKSTRVGALDAVPLLAAFLGFAAPVGYPPLAMSADLQRRKTMDLLAGWTLSLAEGQPLVLFIEDLHWWDSSSLELVGRLIAQGETARVFVLGTARPEFIAPWRTRANLSTLPVARLPRSQTREMVAALNHLLPDETVETLVERADGIPLYVEELTKAVIEPGAARGVEAIPATLADSLMARLDRLSSAKDVAQQAAVIGREFSYAVLATVAGLDEAALRAGLARLIEAEIVFVRGVPPAETYTFKHALVQETAYDALLKSRRRELHRTIARTLDDRFPDIARSQPETIAHHYTRAGEAEPAIGAWERAAEKALERSALGEAADHYGRALAMLATLPDTPSRAQRELVLQMALGHALRGPKGYTSPETARAFARARELGEQVGNADQLIFVLVGLWQLAFNRSEVRGTKEAADQLAAAAERHGGAAARTWAHFAQGVAAFYLGDLEAAHVSLRRARDLYDETDHRGMPSNPGVGILSFLTLTAWLRGCADQARACSADAIALANRLARPSSLAVAHMFSAALHIWLHDAAAVVRLTNELERIATEHGFPVFEAWATMQRAWVLGEHGRHGDAVAQLRDGLARQVASGQRASQPFYLGLLAEACARAGALGDAFETVDDALETEEEIWQAGLLCVRADLLSRRGADPSVVEETYLQALAVAHRQGALAYELRAALSLMRLVRTPDARARLAALYSSFNEGLDTHDLIEAKALLDER
jgi:class 3 adenylate cyclase/tetratricopeptide (TPR) repeat protein